MTAPSRREWRRRDVVDELERAVDRLHAAVVTLAVVVVVDVAALAVAVTGRLLGWWHA